MYFLGRRRNLSCAVVVGGAISSVGLKLKWIWSVRCQRVISKDTRKTKTGGAGFTVGSTSVLAVGSQTGAVQVFCSV